MTLAPRRPVLVCAGVLGLFLLALLAGTLYPQLRAWLDEVPPQAILLRADKPCDPVGQACTVGSDTLAVTLVLEGEVRPLEAFSVQVRLAGRDAAAAGTVSVRFAMPGMDMGINRFGLSRQADRRWHGKAMLPVCSMGRRDWMATVSVTGNPPYRAEFSLRARP